MGSEPACRRYGTANQQQNEIGWSGFALNTPAQAAHQRGAEIAGSVLVECMLRKTPLCTRCREAFSQKPECVIR